MATKIQIPKEHITKFIEKYNLAGKVEQVKWKVENNVLSTDFQSSDKTLTGRVEKKLFEIDDFEIGIWDTTQLNKMLSILDKEIAFFLILDEEKKGFEKIKIKDEEREIYFSLAESSLIDTPKKIKALNFEIVFDILEDFSENFIKSKNALDSLGFFVFKNKKGNVIFSITSDITSNTNRIDIPTGTSVIDGILDTPIKFNAANLKDIFSCNKKIKGKLSISTRGLMKVDFEDTNFISSYYMLKIADNN